MLTPVAFGRLAWQVVDVTGEHWVRNVLLFACKIGIVMFFEVADPCRHALRSKFVFARAAMARGLPTLFPAPVPPLIWNLDSYVDQLRLARMRPVDPGQK